MKAANLAVRFVLELCALAALAYWGAQVDSHVVTRLALAVGAPLLAAVAWGVFVAPERRVDVPVARWAVELGVFAAAVLGLLDAGRTGLAVALAATYAVNRVLVSVWKQ